MPRRPRRTPPDVNSTKYGSYTAAPFSEVLKRAIALVLAAAAAGTLGGIALNRVLASLLTEVGRLDVTVRAGASALIVTSR